jgi:hypothetical protein
VPPSGAAQTETQVVILVSFSMSGILFFGFFVVVLFVCGFVCFLFGLPFV